MAHTARVERDGQAVPSAVTVTPVDNKSIEAGRFRRFRHVSAKVPPGRGKPGADGTRAAICP